MLGASPSAFFGRARKVLPTNQKTHSQPDRSKCLRLRSETPVRAQNFAQMDGSPTKQPPRMVPPARPEANPRELRDLGSAQGWDLFLPGRGTSCIRGGSSLVTSGKATPQSKIRSCTSQGPAANQQGLPEKRLQATTDSPPGPIRRSFAAVSAKLPEHGQIQPYIRTRIPTSQHRPSRKSIFGYLRPSERTKQPMQMAKRRLVGMVQIRAARVLYRGNSCQDQLNPFFGQGLRANQPSKLVKNNDRP